jgi:O-antigen ligase
VTGVSRTLDRLAFGALLLLGLTYGLGDIAQVTPLNTVVLNVVRALLPITIGLALLGGLAGGQLPALPRPIALPMAAWLAVLVLSAANAPTNRLDALAALHRPASGMLLAWVIVALCARDRRWHTVARALALGGLVVALVGVAEATGLPAVQDVLAQLHAGSIPIGDVPRITSTLSHPNVASMVLELTLPLLVAWACTTTGIWRAPLAVATLTALAAIVLTFSRAGIVAALVGVLTMAVVSLGRGKHRWTSVLGLVAVAVPLVLTWMAASDHGFERRLSAGLDFAQLAHARRIEYWSAARDMFYESPWLGVGPDNYRWRFAGYSGVPSDTMGVHAHDQYLEALADTGLLGLLTLGWLLISLVRGAVDGVNLTQADHDWPWRAAVLASLNAWLVHALLDDFERFWPASVAFWLVAGLSMRRSSRSAVERPPGQPNDRNDDNQHQHTDRRSKRRTPATASAEAHHGRALSYSSPMACQMGTLTSRPTSVRTP